ncbi:MAG: hypothetical protein RIE31_07580 [Alphaproteobacteria bacterium]
MTDGLIGAALLALAGLAGFMLRKYVGSYAAEKGRNLATKEDIADITSRLEGVKSDIQILGRLRTDYEQQRRDWLLAFYDAAIELLHDRLALNFGDTPYDEGRSLFNYQQEFRANVATLAKSYQRIVVYFGHDEPVRVHAEEALKAALDARKLVIKDMGELKATMIEEGAAVGSGDRARMEAAVAASNRANKEYWDKMHPAADAFRDALRSYLTALNSFLRPNDTYDPSTALGGRD